MAQDDKAVKAVAKKPPSRSRNRSRNRNRRPQTTDAAGQEQTGTMNGAMTGSTATPVLSSQNQTRLLSLIRSNATDIIAALSGEANRAGSYQHNNPQVMRWAALSGELARINQLQGDRNNQQLLRFVQSNAVDLVSAISGEANRAGTMQQNTTVLRWAQIASSISSYCGLQQLLTESTGGNASTRQRARAATATA